MTDQGDSRVLPPPPALREGEWYRASDGKFYRWPDPTPYDQPPRGGDLLPPPPARPVAPPRRSFLRRYWPALLGLALLAGYISDSARDDERAGSGGITLAGDLTLRGGGSWEGPASGSYCWGKNGYDDIRAGAQVTVTDGAGRVLGLGQLDAGSKGGTQCVFRFRVRGLPRSDFYAVEVSHRGQVRYTAADVDAGRVSLTLG